MKKLVKLVTAFMLVAAALAGCSSDSSTSESSVSEGSSSSESTTIKIGAFGPYTGDYAEYGLAVLQGAQLALKDFQESTGKLLDAEVVLQYEDTQGDPTSAVNAYNKLVDDGVVAILGGVLSGESTAVASATQSNGKLPMISASATAPEFVMQGDNIFRGCFTDPQQAAAMAEYAYEVMGLRKVAVVYEPTDYSQGLVDNFKEAFENLGGAIVDEEVYPTKSTDFSTYLTTIASKDVDGLYLPVYYGDVAMIAQQARQLGLDVPMFGNDGWGGVLAAASDPSVFNGAVFVNHTPIDDPQINAFTEAYTSAYGVEPISFSYLGYDCMNLILQAIEEAGTTETEALTEAFKNIQFEGITGSISFDENGDAVKSYNYVTFTDGAYADVE